MKVIGIADDGEYICQVSHTEIEKLTDKYYGNLAGKLKPGSEMDLGAGYDFRNAIKKACDSLIEAERDFDSARKTIHKFAAMVASLPTPGQGEDA